MDKVKNMSDIFKVFKKYTSGELDFLPLKYSEMLIYIKRYISLVGPDPVLLYLYDQQEKENYELCHLIVSAIRYNDNENNKDYFSMIKNFDYSELKNINCPTLKSRLNSIDLQINHIINSYDIEI